MEFKFDTFTITKREVVASISIVAILLLLGFFISGKISDHQMDRDAIYNKAVKIEDKDLFSYGMRTNIGHAFVYGTLMTVDPVSYPEIEGSYIYLEKVKEKYTRHTRTVTTRDSKGHTHRRTEVYWSWDRVRSEELCCEKVQFLGVIFPSSKFQLPDSHYLETIKESQRIRYKYYGTDLEYVGTIFTELKDGTITDHTRFYENRNLEETFEQLKSMDWRIPFWIVWVLMIVGCVFGFYYLDNHWLE